MKDNLITLLLPRKILMLAISLLVIISIIGLFPSAVSAANDTSEDVSLQVNGKILTMDVSPKIIDSRTLIPVRALFEEIGGDVEWNSTARAVTIDYNDHNIRLLIDSTTAKVDNKEVKLDVPAKIIDDRTLIPVRFVAENLGFKVDWNASTRTVFVNSSGGSSQVTPAPAPVPESNKINSVKVEHGDATNMYNTVTVSFANPITASSYAGASLSNPDRYYIDFYNSTVSSSYVGTLFSTSDTHSAVASIRSGTRDNNTTFRLVFDLNQKKTPTVELSSDKKYLVIKFTKNTDYTAPTTQTTPPATQTTPTTPTTGTTTGSTTGTTTGTTTQKPTTTPTTPTNPTPQPQPAPVKKFDPYADGKLVVVLDPGHGKDTPGKRSPDGTLREYEFNRDVAYRLKANLEKNGIKVIMTVSDNVTDVPLKDRVAIANNATDADIYVSIHANAFGNGVDWENDATGWEVYYYESSSTGKNLANFIHDANKGSIGIKDRGVKTANFYVIKYTSMPAVLIEHGFFTSKTEVELLKTSSFRQKCADLDAKGIINFFNSYKK